MTTTRLRALVIAFLVIVAGTPAASAGSGWKVFTHPFHGFSLTYPDAWVVARPSSQLIAVVLIGPRVGVSDVRLNVNVVVESLTTSMTPEQYQAANEPFFRQIAHGYHHLRTDRLTAGTLPVLLRYYSWKRNDEVELYQVQLLTVVGTRGYVVTGTTAAHSPNLNSEAQLLARIVMTFRAVPLAN